MWRALLLLAVVEGEGERRFTSLPSNTTAVAGSVAVLECGVGAAAGLRVQWTRDGFGLGLERKLPTFPGYSMVDREGQDGGNFLAPRDIGFK